jgi:lipoate-protein ligase B
LESALFGVAIHSVIVRTVDQARSACDAAVDGNGLTVLRVPGECVGTAQIVERSGGNLCDVLVTLGRSIPPGGLTDGTSHQIELRLSDPGDAAELAELGRSAREKNLLTSTEFLAARGVELYEVERGGDVTFHGPGQLVGYPIVNLRQHKQDLHWYLRTLEGILIGGLRTLGLEAESREKLTGVWTNGRKIASIGVHARDWVTWHGFALNVNTDLSFFDLIVPCGIDGVVMTSVARELNVAVADPAAAADAMVESSASALDLRPCAVTAASLRDIVSAGQQNGAGSASAA